MYQAIVFLPLLGAIIGGLITLFGAYRRVMAESGGDHGHHGHDHAHEHAHQAHGHDADADGGHGDHDHVEPAEGSRPTEVVTTLFLMISAILSWVAFFSVGFTDAAPLRIAVAPWFSIGTLSVDWAFRIDTLTVVMLVVVNTVSALVHLYSIGYMAHDPHRPRFFAYLSIFTFAMLMLVTADNLVQMFFGWEGVGLASYLLIGFWFQRETANAAAIKAFVVNRVGDFGFALGIFGVFMLFNTVEFEAIFANAPSIAGKSMHFLSWDFDALTVVCLLLFMGAMGKSAQFLLHTWLPDAMEGPTPVSALIHAATMVTAGVVMVARLSPLFEHSHVALTVVTVVGATTAFFAATVGLVQNDIKRVIAYSTCSQLGYMFVALGVGKPAVAMFHLFTHAFFKALLFLGAGSVIHAMSNEQDMQRMGGLKAKIPLTYWMMVIGTLALTGFPFTAGFFSKDAIIEAAFAGHGEAAGYAYAMTLLAALMTSFYSWRLIFMTFHGKPKMPEVYSHAHELPLVMTLPLMILAVGALLAGLVFAPSFIGHGMAEFWRGAVVLGEAEHAEAAHSLLDYVIEYAPTIAMAIGFLIAYQFYIRNPEAPARLAANQPVLYRFLLNKWYFDELYEAIFVKPVMCLGRFLWKFGDVKIIDGLGPDGISARVVDVTRNVVRLQSGYLYHYAFAMLIGISLLVSWVLFH